MRTDFLFRSILLEYYFVLSGIKDKLDRKLITEEEATSLRYTNKEWFSHMRSNAFCCTEYYTESRNKNKLNKKAFLLPDDKRCPGCQDGKPYSVIIYRSVEIPVYDDDYGQQDFAVIDGEEICGGAYNLLAYEEFLSAVDSMLERNYMDGKYDMHKEIKKCFPEYYSEEK